MTTFRAMRPRILSPLKRPILLAKREERWNFPPSSYTTSRQRSPLRQCMQSALFSRNRVWVRIKSIRMKKWRQLPPSPWSPLRQHQRLLQLQQLQQLQQRQRQQRRKQQRVFPPLRQRQVRLLRDLLLPHQPQDQKTLLCPRRRQSHHQAQRGQVWYQNGFLDGCRPHHWVQHLRGRPLRIRDCSRTSTFQTGWEVELFLVPPSHSFQPRESLSHYKVGFPRHRLLLGLASSWS